MSSSDIFAKVHLPYQIERFSLEDDGQGGVQVSVTYTSEADVMPGAVEFHSVVFNPAQPELDAITADILKRLCYLVDAYKEQKARFRQRPRQPEPDQ